MSDLINARENFEDLKDNKTALRVFAGGSLVSGVKFDEINILYPSGTIEIYEYKLASTTKASVQLTYSNSSKNTLINVKLI